MQQRRHGCGSKQRACVRQQAVAAGGMIALDGMQPVCVRQWAADAACMQQHAAAAACVWQQVGAAGSMIAMRTVMAVASRRHNCDGQRRRRRRKGRQDSRKIAMNNNYSDGQLWVKASIGGHSG